MSCSGLAARRILGVALTLTLPLALLLAPGDSAPRVYLLPGFSVSFSSILVGVVALASSIGIFLVSWSYIASLSYLAGAALLVALEESIASIAVFAFFALVLLFAFRLRGFAREPLLDLVSFNLSEWSPLALSAAALSLYLVRDHYLVGHDWRLQSVYAVFAIAAAIVAASSSSRLLESLTLGLLSGLGPLGLAVSSVWCSLKPLPAGRCSGIELGELVAVERAASPSRAALSYSSTPRRVLACSSGRAILALREPWILWSYGSAARRLLSEAPDRLLERGVVVLDLCSEGPQLPEIEPSLEKAFSGESRVVRLNLGSIYPVEARVAYALSIGRGLSEKGYRSLVFDCYDCDVKPEELLRIAIEAPRFAERVVVILSGLVWGPYKLSPPGSATSSGFIAGGLRDPAEASSLASVVAPEAREDLASLLRREEVALGYPGCAGEVLILRV